LQISINKRTAQTTTITQKGEVTSCKSDKRVAIMRGVGDYEVSLCLLQGFDRARRPVKLSKVCVIINYHI